MILLSLLNYLLSILFATAAFFLNCYILFSIFYQKRIPINQSMTFIYWKFSVDVVYTLNLTTLMFYYLLISLSANFIIKNLTFWLVWASTSIGSMRSLLALLISFERVLATYFPIYFHKYRQRFPNFIVLLIIVTSGFFDQYTLFGYCGNDIDTPLECKGFSCAVNTCYYSYYFSNERVVCFMNGVFSLTLFFRFFVWKYVSKTQTNERISRATRIALLDFFIMIFFNILASYITTIFNLQNVGPLTIVTKTLGFVIEGVITCRVLFGAKNVVTVVVTTNSQKSS
ncbi:Serpentine Receptor, class BC (Class B-like) [Caenorhabditis elegans]|uniref:Serpentine Receptor, class BC (Class B-like) n=1 Tax=Caenorhabditis elegans TaxID=6239 RepID=O17957_CAEEL|nr:Serpentine Receptor, class BC (Class B-like) [Caenorhabditis elegans]CAB05561.1 Serpentine Receptor, class BC (Class B-like) [Caenorhabditis elegans]|eukprot:NP_506775.1 Serpentine Receptor, class BC (class B-like) [Caenorhabditis elegans]